MPNKTAKNGSERESKLKTGKGNETTQIAKNKKGTFDKRIGRPVDRQQ